MLSLSQSGMSHSFISSGYSESVDLEVVDEIIERSPRSATAFPVVYKAYVSVLQDKYVPISHMLKLTCPAEWS